MGRDRWDMRFLALAEHIAAWSKDPSTKCGAVIVRPNRTIASVGYNGFPRGVVDDPRLYEEREEKYSRIVHAEMNAILSASESLAGYTLYVWPPGMGPTCDRCAAAVIQTGIRRVVGLDADDKRSRRWSMQGIVARKMYEQAGVKVDVIRASLAELGGI